MKITTDFFGKLSDGSKVDIITITNDNGVVCKFSNYGGILISWLVPDKNGKKRDIVLGYDTIKEYENDSSFLGAIIGRYGNRIAHGRFTLDGKEFVLAKNLEPHHLHGGVKGFNKVVWDYSIVEEAGIKKLKLSYMSRDMEEGYPGNLNVIVKYSLTEDDQLIIEYEAVTDKKTIVNLTNHAYFNLTGGVKDILDHVLKLKADHYTPGDKTLIPSGEIKAVKGTDFDFNEPVEIGKRIKKIDIGGYDHNYVLTKKHDALEKAGEVYDPDSGLMMEFSTSEPGVQFYTAIHFDGFNGKNNLKYGKYYGYCLEAQHFPDSPNKPNFPSTVLNPGEVYKQTTIYKVTVKQN